jgi:Trk K+ transport system NAD-binding subunit
MYRLRIAELRVPPRRKHAYERKLWREWCFAQSIARRFWLRLLILPVLLVVGSFFFQWCEPQHGHDFIRGMYYTWTLVFAQPPEAFPRHPLLQVWFFLVPVIGLTVILQTIVEVALLLRERRNSERSWNMTMAAALTDHIILVGVGKLGYHTYRLLRKLGEQVVVVERDERVPFLEEVRRDNAPLIIGDGRREELLIDANVKDARAVVIATNDDLGNLEIALDARRLNPRIRVVMRMFDQTMADKIRDAFNIHLSMSQSAISAPTFAMAAIDRTIVNSFVVNNELVVTQRWLVNRDGPLCGKTVADLLAEYGVTVVEQRSGPGAARLFPPPDATLDARQELLVQGTFEKVLAFRRRHREAATAPAAAAAGT